MDNYEKNVDKALDAVEKIAGAGNRVYIGCAILFANLFFAGFCLWGIIPAMFLTALIVNFFMIRSFWRNDTVFA